MSGERGGGEGGVPSARLRAGSVAGVVVVEAGGGVEALAGVEAVGVGGAGAGAHVAPGVVGGFVDGGAGVVGDPFDRLRAGSGGGAEVVLVDVAHMVGMVHATWRVVSLLVGVRAGDGERFFAFASAALRKREGRCALDARR